MKHLALPAIVVLLSAAQVKAEQFTLDEAIRYGLSHQPDMATAAAQTMSAAGQVRVAASGYLPTVSVDASNTRIQDQPAGFRGASTSISARQLIYDMGRTPKSIASARASLRAARAVTQDTRILVSGSITNAYFSLLQASSVLGAYQETVKSREAERDAAAAKLEAGTAARFDVLRAETDLAQSRQDLSAAQGSLRRAQTALNATMGRPADAAIEAVEPPAAPEIDATRAVAEALAARPDVEASRQNLEAARNALSATRLNNAPAISAGGDFSGSHSGFPATDLRWSVGVSVAWTVFDGLRLQGEVQSARASVLRAEADLRRSELLATREVTDAVTAVQVAAEQVRLGEATLAQAVEARDVAAGRYNAGAGTQLEVSDAQSQLLLAQVTLINARYALAANRRALLYAMGRETPTAPAEPAPGAMPQP